MGSLALCFIFHLVLDFLRIREKQLLHQGSGNLASRPKDHLDLGIDTQVYTSEYGFVILR